MTFTDSMHLLYIYMMLRFVGKLINTHDDDERVREVECKNLHSPRFTDAAHFNGPGRAVSLMCVCLCVCVSVCLDNNF